MSFTETWLKEIHQDDHVNIDGFKILRGDRTEESGRKGGGGVCLYINESYCHPNNSVIKSHSCSPNIEILTVSIRPYYLPREFSHIVMMTIYIPHQRVATQAAVELCQAIQHIESSAPNAFICINGDFNHCNLKKSGFKYHQHVTCPTRGQNTLDLCYTNVKDAYVASGLPKLGDHNLVLLKPKYRPLVQRQKPSLKTVRHFTHDTIQQLQGCLASTDWQVFIENTVDLNELTETIGDYINFCTDLTIPKKLVKIYSNNKPRITKNAKTVINRKKYIYKNGSKEELRAIQKQLKTVLQKDRVAYKIKIEKNFTENNMKQIWKGMRLMSGHSNGNDTAFIGLIENDNYEHYSSQILENLDILWKTSWLLRPKRPGWSGLMQSVCHGPHPGKSSVHFLPMIDMDPTDMSCIYSTLHFVAAENHRQGTTPMLTFDQPLYWKAKTIIVHEKEGSELKPIVLNLGGFHSVMSFLGCMGHVMKASGLKEILELIYAENAVTQMLGGKPMHERSEATSWLTQP
ncbi:hypothetical protein GQR58_024747 [Nymphon striatum]|nr:hypothetical protein GQR58_024747 [Nymphon striatum]